MLTCLEELVVIGVRRAVPRPLCRAPARSRRSRVGESVPARVTPGWVFTPTVSHWRDARRQPGARGHGATRRPTT